MGKLSNELAQGAAVRQSGEVARGRILTQFGLSRTCLALFGGLATIPLLVRDEYITRLLVSALMLGTHAMAFDFTAGFINVVNFGYSAFAGVGGYATGLVVVNLGAPSWVGMMVGAGVSGLIGLFLGLLTLRLRGIFASCMSWFVALTLMSIAANWVGMTRGHSGLSVPPLYSTTSNLPYFYTVLALSVLTYALLTGMIRSRIGLAFQAIGQDLDAAKSCGINPLKYRVLNFTVACAFAGLVGAFYAHFVGVMTPRNLHTANTVEVMAVSYVGGRGSIWGGLVCAMILVPLMEYLRPFLEVRLIAYGSLLIASMLFFPEGLAGLWKGAVASVIRWRAAAGAGG